MRALLLSLLLLAASTPAMAAEPQPLSLAELIDIALNNHPLTRQAWWNARRAAAVLGDARSSYYPQVDVDANITNGRTFKFVNGPDTDYTIVGADLILSLLLYDFGGRSAAVDAAKNALWAANWQTDTVIQKVMVGVLENGYALAHAKELYRAASISQQDAEHLLTIAAELNRIGLKPVSDVYTTKVTFLQMKMDATQQQAHVDIQKAKLAASVGLSADTPMELVSFEPPLDTEQQPPQFSALIQLAYKQRTDLFAQQARVAASLARIDQAKAGYGPKVSFLGSGGANHALHDKANALQYEVMVNLDLPLFNGFSTMYQERKALADAHISNEEMYELQLNISLEVLTHARSLEAAQAMLPDAQEQLTNASQAYDSVIERYQAGKEGIDDVSNALRRLAAARVRYSDVKTQWFLSVARLAYATGTLSPYLRSAE